MISSYASVLPHIWGIFLSRDSNSYPDTCFQMLVTNVRIITNFTVRICLGVFLNWALVPLVCIPPLYYLPIRFVLRKPLASWQRDSEEAVVGRMFRCWEILLDGKSFKACVTFLLCKIILAVGYHWQIDLMLLADSGALSPFLCSSTIWLIDSLIDWFSVEAY